LALEWDDIDDAARQARVKWGVSEGRLEATPKDGPRTVDLSRQTVDVLRRLLVERKAEALRQGWGAVPRWVFCDDQGERLSARDVRAGFKRALRAAGLPAHFTPHGLRHTYATLLLGDGASPVYVQQQLGHSSIRLTVDLYGKWIPVPNKGVVDRLDVLAEEPGSKTVAEAAVHQLKR